MPSPALPSDDPALRFTPYAWARYHWLCHRGPSEIGAFALTDEDDLLLVTDLLVVRQQASTAGVRFDDAAVADLFDELVDRGVPPERFARIWLHTHPGRNPEPSGLDETTFARAFGRCHWAVMAILARDGATYARLRFNVGPGGAVRLPVAVDYGRAFPGSDHAAWDEEYRDRVHVIDERLPRRQVRHGLRFDEDDLTDQLTPAPADDGWDDDDELNAPPDGWAHAWENEL